MTSEGVQIDLKDLDAVQHLKDREPKSGQGPLGFLGYFRTFIQDFYDSQTTV